MRHKKVVKKNNVVEKSFFRKTNIFRFLGLGLLLVSSYVPSPELDLLGLKGSAFALSGVVLLLAPVLRELVGRFSSGHSDYYEGEENEEI